MANRDAAEMVFNLLKNSSAAGAVAVRALLVYGANSVIEAGDLVADNLNSAEAQRESESNPAKALYLSVQDGGEAQTGQEGVLQQIVVLRIYDRRRGYNNIRAVRDAIRAYLRGHGLGTIDGGGLAALFYQGRSGHKYDRDFAVEWEGITFEATVRYAVDDD